MTARTDDSMPVALVTGANRGIGLEVCRQLARRGIRVIVTSRDADAGRRETDLLAREGAPVEFFPLDVTDREAIEARARDVRRIHGRLDILVNNAGVYDTIFSPENSRRTIRINVHGPAMMTDAFLPLMGGGGRIVMVSSGMGELSGLGIARRKQFQAPGLTREKLFGLVEEFLSDVDARRHGARGWPDSAYRVSKAALNALTRLYDGELKGKNILVNAVCPGWVRTGMGGPGAPRRVEEGASGIVWAACLPGSGPRGGFFRDGKPIPW